MDEEQEHEDEAGEGQEDGRIIEEIDKLKVSALDHYCRIFLPIEGEKQGLIGFVLECIRIVSINVIENIGVAIGIDQVRGVILLGDPVVVQYVIDRIHVGIDIRLDRSGHVSLAQNHESHIGPLIHKAVQGLVVCYLKLVLINIVL